MDNININIGSFKIYQVSGTASVVIGNGSYNKQSSQSKVNNGVGNAYGDHSDIQMSPYQPTLNDADIYDSNTDKRSIKKTSNKEQRNQNEDSR